jgi:hypothetical protein
MNEVHIRFAIERTNEKRRYNGLLAEGVVTPFGPITNDIYTKGEFDYKTKTTIFGNELLAESRPIRRPNRLRA